MTNEIEVSGLRGEISAQETKLAGLKDAFQEAISAGDAVKLLDLGKQIQRCEDEIVTLEKRYARMTGEAVPNLKGIAATNLKAAVSSSIAPNIGQIRELVRQVWSLQTDRKLEKIVLNFSQDDVTEMPTISLVGGFREVGEVKSGANRKQREVIRWVVPGEAEPLTRKSLVLRFGTKYGQVKPWAAMTPDERQKLGDEIVAGEGFATA